MRMRNTLSTGLMALAMIACNGEDTGSEPQEIRERVQITYEAEADVEIDIAREALDAELAKMGVSAELVNPPFDRVANEDGVSVVEFERELKGFPVIGGSFSVFLRAGHVESITAAHWGELEIDNTPTIHASLAVETAREAYDGTISEIVSKRLVVDAVSEELEHLAWEVVVSGTRDGLEPVYTVILVHAHESRVLSAWEQVDPNETE